jgi:UDP-GlcNAc:undecaprenyl-phosphate/decaprenyl-phosphate GlcNAc-1-phosphate transferase
LFSYLLAFSTALIVSLPITRIVREWAKNHGWVDKPDGKRKLHRVPTPRIGGLGIYIALLIGTLPILFLHTQVADYVSHNFIILVQIVALSGAMLLIGLWDDLKNASAWKKFLAQSVVAVLCWIAGFRILEVWTGDHVHLWWVLSIPLTVLWIVGITNAFNLIDGIDGLAAGAALFATLTMLVVSVMGGFALSAVLLSALSGAILGFLRYNFNPATIFLGDCGSYLLGFILALLSIRGSQKNTAAFAIAVPIVALGLPMLDTGLAIARRFVRGNRIFSADKRHIHHLLISRGLSPKHAVILLYGISGLFGLFSLCFINPAGKTNGVVLAILGACIWFGIRQLRYSEMKGLTTHISRGFQNQRKLLAGSVVVGQMIEELRNAKDINQLTHAIGSGLEELCFSRFELSVSNSGGTVRLDPGNQWKVTLSGMESIVLDWTSPCWSCQTRSHAKEEADLHPYLYPEENCETFCNGCERLKNPILQKGMPNHLGPEYRITFPLFDVDASDLGTARFYHPSGREYPISAIVILSQNIGQEFEKALQKIFCEIKTASDRAQELSDLVFRTNVARQTEYTVDVINSKTNDSRTNI